MTKRIIIISLISAISLTTFSQNRILVTGFPVKNFETDRKPIEKYAEKNEISVAEVPQIFKESLADNMYTRIDTFKFVNIGDSLQPNFEKFKYTTQTNSEGKEYIGFDSNTDYSELKEFMDKYKGTYLLHFSNYQIYKRASFLKRPGHRIDYFILDKDMKVVIADKLKVKGLASGSVYTEVVEGKYLNFGKKIAKELYKETILK